MPKPEPEIGNMTNPLLSGEETAKLVERLQTRASNWERIGADDHAALDRQAAALLTTQASEIERLRGERDGLKAQVKEACDIAAEDHLAREAAEAERDEARRELAMLKAGNGNG